MPNSNSLVCAAFTNLFGLPNVVVEDLDAILDALDLIIQGIQSCRCHSPYESSPPRNLPLLRQNLGALGPKGRSSLGRQSRKTSVAYSGLCVFRVRAASRAASRKLVLKLAPYPSVWR